jgi:hypothetical protein
MHIACRRGDLGEVERYLEAGGDIEEIIVSSFPASGLSPHLSQLGNTPLSVACRWGHTEVVSLLMEKGASLESQDNVRYACCVIQSPLLISLRMEILVSISLASMAMPVSSLCCWREEGASIWRVAMMFVSSLSLLVPSLISPVDREGRLQSRCWAQEGGSLRRRSLNVWPSWRRSRRWVGCLRPVEQLILRTETVRCLCLCLSPRGDSSSLSSPSGPLSESCSSQWRWARECCSLRPLPLSLTTAPLWQDREVVSLRAQLSASGQVIAELRSERWSRPSLPPPPPLPSLVLLGVMIDDRSRGTQRWPN